MLLTAIFEFSTLSDAPTFRHFSCVKILKSPENAQLESYFVLQVAKLFQNDEDLLREFGQFLPDAGGAVGASMPSSITSAASMVCINFSSIGSVAKVYDYSV